MHNRSRILYTSVEGGGANEHIFAGMKRDIVFNIIEERNELEQMESSRHSMNHGLVAQHQGRPH